MKLNLNLCLGRRPFCSRKRAIVTPATKALSSNMKTHIAAIALLALAFSAAAQQAEKTERLTGFRGSTNAFKLSQSEYPKTNRPAHKYDVIVLQASMSWDYEVFNGTGYRWTNGFRIQATDGSEGTGVQPVSGWAYVTNNTVESGSSGNLPFAETVARYLDQGYFISVGGVSSPQGYDPVTLVLVRPRK